MRATIHALLTGTPDLVARVPAERWFQAGAVIDIPARPFVVLRWLAPVAGNASGSFAHQLQVAVYDTRGSYSRIDAFLGGPFKTGGVYPVLSALMDYEGVDGRISQADYLGTSGDDVDVDYKANTKFSSWQIAGRSF